MKSKAKGKHKGNRWENLLYDTLRKKNVFVRKSKGSGNAEDNKGDLETNNLLIECKHYKKVTDKMIVKWMQKIYNEAMPLEKYPLLIVKENYKEPRVYYYDKNMEINFLTLDFWLNNALLSEVSTVKKEIPSYIG